MKAIFIILGLVLFAAAAIVPGLYGAYVAFKASIILGVVVLVVEPAPVVIGWVALFGRSDVCQKLAAWLHLPF